MDTGIFEVGGESNNITGSKVKVHMYPIRPKEAERFDEYTQLYALES